MVKIAESKNTPVIPAWERSQTGACSVKSSTTR
jgi:hypothetical protein